MGTNSKLKATFKNEIFTVPFAPIWVIFQNSVTFMERVGQNELRYYGLSGRPKMVTASKNSCPPYQTKYLPLIKIILIALVE